MKESNRRRVARAVSNPFTFGILKWTTLPMFTPSKEGLAVVGTPELKAERRRSFGATFPLLQLRHGRDHLGSRSSTLSTNSGASTSGSEDGKLVEPGHQDRSRFPLSQRESRRNPKRKRRTIVQDRTFPLYDWSLLWPLIMIVLPPPTSYRHTRPLLFNKAATKLRRRGCSIIPEQS